MKETEMCIGCHGQGWITAGYEKCPNCDGTGETNMETYYDAEEMNLEIRLQAEEFRKELMQLLGQANAMLLVKNGKIYVEMQEIKSAGNILQHSNEFCLGEQYTYYG